MRIDLYVCDRCGSEHKNAGGLLKVNVMEASTGRRGPAKANGPALDLCAPCVKDLRAWAKSGKPRRNGAPAETPEPVAVA